MSNEKRLWFVALSSLLRFAFCRAAMNLLKEKLFSTTKPVSDISLPFTPDEAPGLEFVEAFCLSCSPPLLPLSCFLFVSLRSQLKWKRVTQTYQQMEDSANRFVQFFTENHIMDSLLSSLSEYKQATTRLAEMSEETHQIATYLTRTLADLKSLTPCLDEFTIGSEKEVCFFLVSFA
jgi:hypothetical protein